MTKFDIFVVNLRRSVDRREAMREKIKRIRGFAKIYIDGELVCGKNSSLGVSFALGKNFGEQQTASLVLSSKFSTNTKLPPQILELDSNANSADSSLRGSVSNEAIQKNESCDSTNQISPDSWCKKSESKGAVVPPADFLLESEKRGSPPKSEKRQLLARRGSGAGGAALLREKTSESSAKSVDCFGDKLPRNDDNVVDCHDSATNLTQNFRHTERSEVSKSSESSQAQNAMTQERMGESYRFTQSKKIVGDSQIAKIDSSLTAFAQNDDRVDCFRHCPRNDDNAVDCHESANAESRNDNNIDLSPQDEFASTLHFHFFPATDATDFKNEKSPLPPQYSSKLTRFVKGKDLSFGEMACFSSHYRLWQKCVALDSPIIVLEDDIDFMQDFCQIIEIFKSPFEYVRLYYLFDRKITHLYDNFYISFDRTAGTQGYYLTPQAAQKFIKNARFWLFCVDDYMDMFFIHSVKNIIFKPFIISEDLDSATQSTILGREKPQMRFYQKLTRELSRIYFFAIRKYLYFALHCVELRAFFRANRR